jgi:hypothetical protein
VKNLSAGKITKYEVLTILLSLVCLLAILGLVLSYFFSYFSEAWATFEDWLKTNSILPALVITAIVFFILSLISLNISRKKSRENQINEEKNKDHYVQLIMPFYKANKETIEKVRTDMWTVYNSNAQNHSGQVLTIFLALVTLLLGVQSFPNNLIFGSILLLSFGSLILLFIWLSLRNQYWAYLSSNVLLMTTEEILKNFNEYNERNRIYLTYNEKRVPQ